MFDWPLFFLLVLVCVPGLLITIPCVLKTVQETIIDQQPEGKKLPSKQFLVTVSIVQNIIIIMVTVFMGVLLAKRVGFAAPFFEALASGGNWLNELTVQLSPALIIGASGAVVFITAYYYIFRPRLDSQSLVRMENLRMSLGIWSRILYGGIVEEVITRWGLMTFITWLLSLITGNVSGVLIWVSIVISGILFGIGHFPSYLAAGCRKTPVFISLVISLNLGASLIFGWLFWQYGLLAAMLAHMLFHLIWYPFDLYTVKNHTMTP